MRAAGLVYPELDGCVVPVPEKMPTGRLVGGLDFGLNDPFAAMAGILDNDNVLWLFFERYMRGKTLDEHAKYLPKEVQWYADAARPDSIKDLRRMGFMVRAAKKRLWLHRRRDQPCSFQDASGETEDHYRDVSEAARRIGTLQVSR